MKITKTQIDYLRHRLQEIKSEKMKEFSKDVDKYWSDLDVAEAIKSGLIKMKAKKDLRADGEYSKLGYRSCYITNIFDTTKFEEKYAVNLKAQQEYEEKLDKKMTEIMDKVVLSDLLIEEAVAEFKKL